jgi:predicted enzyme related to lactoylglutathione lyase
MRMTKYAHGVPSWVDLGTKDLPGAIAFYSALFGWDIPAGPAESGEYRLAEIDGVPVAGVGPLMNPMAPPCWTSYINVDDADAVAALVTSNGGAVFAPPFDVLDVGRMGIFADPQGAVFGVWQARAHIGAGLVNQVDTWCWNELLTSDVDGAKRFYSAVFGWDAHTSGEGPGAYTEFQLAGRSIAGGMPKPEMMPAEAPSCWSVYFSSADIDASAARVKALGGQVHLGPQQIEPGRFIMAADPSGVVFHVIQFNELPA